MTNQIMNQVVNNMSVIMQFVNVVMCFSLVIVGLSLILDVTRK